jgi:hypothetical protein
MHASHGSVSAMITEVTISAATRKNSANDRLIAFVAHVGERAMNERRVDRTDPVWSVFVPTK